APTPHHPARNCERRLLDKLLDSKTGADLRADLLIAITSFGPRRRNPNRHDRIVRRGETDRIHKRASILLDGLDVMICRDRRDNSVAEPMLDRRGAIGDCDRGATRRRFDNQVLRRYQTAKSASKRRVM